MLATPYWTPLRWWDTTGLTDLSRGLDSVMDGWTKGWFTDADRWRAGTRCNVAHEAGECADVAWRLLGASEDASAWIFFPARAREELRVALFAGTSGPIAADIAHTACLEFEEALRSFLHLHPGADCELPPAPMFRPWGGAVLGELSWPGGQPCLLLMNSECVARLPRTSIQSKPIARHSHELVSCELALAGAKVTLRVELEPCELEIGNLAALQLGDVIPWPHALENPLNVKLGDNMRICSGHLGRVNSFKAVELLA